MGGGCELRPAAAAAGRAREERRARAEGLDPRGIGSQVCTKLATVCTAIPRCPKTRARSMASSPPASREGAGRGGPPPTPPTQFEGHAGPPSLSSLCCASSSVPSAFQTNPSAGSIGGAARVFVWGGGEGAFQATGTGSGSAWCPSPVRSVLGGRREETGAGPGWAAG